MDDRCVAYFSSINPLARKIIKDVGVLKDAIGGRWKDLEWSQQEDLIDDYMVDVSVRERMSGVEKFDTYPQSFPKLKVDTGEKVLVDFENDCWTWQDEHSSPFNWRTKSQQDLTLDDLEPEVLSTTPSRGKKKESEPQADTEHISPASREFSVKNAGSIWESPFLQGMKKPDFLNRSSRSRSVSPSKSIGTSKESLHSRSKTPEEVNYAFTGSLDDLSSSPSSHRSLSLSSTEMLSSSPGKENAKQKSSPSRNNVSSIKNSVAGAKDNHGSLSLVTRKESEDNAFDNPALSNEWSSFVNEGSEEEPSSNTPSPYKRLLKEPEPVCIDRGDHTDLLADRGDHSDVMGGEVGGAGYHDEVLMVETQEPVDADTQNSSSLFKTGFDFLDNW